MRRKLLSVVLCVCMMMTMAPFAFATEGDGNEVTPTASSSGSSGSSATIIKNEEALRNAIFNADEGATININGTIEITSPLNITESITLTSSDGKSVIKAGSSFTGTRLINMETSGKTLTLNNITLDANQKCRVIFANAGKLVVQDGTKITGGKVLQNGYVAGVYMTAQAAFEMTGGEITGNSNSSTSKTYTDYAEDLWIGANANGELTAITGGKIGSAFVNANEWSANNPGGFKMSGGEITNLYVEYANGYGAKFTYDGGRLDNLYISTLTGNGNCMRIAKPTPGTVYRGGVLEPVAQIGNNTYYALSDAATAAENGNTIKLLKDTSERLTIDNGKNVTLDLDGKTLTVPSDIGINVTGKDTTLTITGDGTITCNATPIGVTEGTVIIENGKIISTNDYGIYAKDGGTVTVNGGTLTSKDAVLAGNNTTGNMNFIVNGGTLTAQQGPAIYMPGQVSLNVTNGTLNGGISLRMGQVNISGGTINAITQNIDSPAEYYDYFGCAWFPDALYVIGGTYTSKDTTYGNSLNLNITGGTFNCTNSQGSAVAIYDLGKIEQIANVTISGDAKLATNSANRTAYDVLSLADIGVTNPKANYGTHSGKVSSAISGGYFSTNPSAYCVTGLTGIENKDDATKTTYPYTVGTLDAANDNDIKTATATGKNTVSVSGVESADQTDAQTVAQSVAPANNTPISETTPITESDKAQALTALVTANKVTLTLDNKIPDGTTVSVVKETYFDVKLTQYNNAGADSTVVMDITPMYNLVAVAKTGSAEDKVTLKSAQPAQVTAGTQITVTLPDAFKNQKVYINHNNGQNIYIATADEDGNITFTTNGFSPFAFALKDASAVAEVNGNAYKTLQEAANAANDGDTITLNSGSSHVLDFNTTKSVKVTNKTGAETTVKFNGTDKKIAQDATETFSYTRPSSGSSSGSTTYAVNVNAATNGAVAADKKTAAKGTTVTVTATPSTGYVVDSVKVVDKDGKDVAVTVKNGKYVFTMPGSAVTVTGTFKAETPAPSGLPFVDVKSGDWFYNAVKYAYENGLMTGTSATTFAPNGTMNRAMIVTVLYRLEKTPAVTAASKFTDVPAGQWYSDAVAWAAANNIVNGYDETTFGPMNAVTREQMAAILFRYEQYKGLENVTLEENLNRFPDKDKISAYAVPALQWAVGQKIINGNADGTLDPTGTATRAQVAQIFTNLLNK